LNPTILPYCFQGELYLSIDFLNFIHKEKAYVRHQDFDHCWQLTINQKSNLLNPNNLSYCFQMRLYRSIDFLNFILKEKTFVRHQDFDHLWQLRKK